MSYQHIENLLIRFRGQAVTIKTVSGGVYEGAISDVTNDYVALKVKKENEPFVARTQREVSALEEVKYSAPGGTFHRPTSLADLLRLMKVVKLRHLTGERPKI